MKDNFRFIETKNTKGIVDKVDKLAKKEKRSLNYYVGQVLMKHCADHIHIEENE